jgi:two-component system cell cycle response regulator DivK
MQILPRTPSGPRKPSPRGATRTRRRTNAKDPLVLIVEDHEDSREGYAGFFRYKGVRVVTAADGREALDLAARLVPDVIVMDLAMPRMNGWTAIERLKSQSRTKHIPVLALSAHAGYEDEMKAWGAGTNAFRAKPCLPDELLDEIRRLLGGSGRGPAGSQGSGRAPRGRVPSRRRRSTGAEPDEARSTRVGRLVNRRRPR